MSVFIPESYFNYGYEDEKSAKKVLAMETWMD